MISDGDAEYSNTPDPREGSKYSMQALSWPPIAPRPIHHQSFDVGSNRQRFKHLCPPYHSAFPRNKIGA